MDISSCHDQYLYQGIAVFWKHLDLKKWHIDFALGFLYQNELFLDLFVPLKTFDCQQSSCLL